MRPYELLHLHSCPNQATTDRQFQQIAGDVFGPRHYRHPASATQNPRLGRLRTWLQRSGSPTSPPPKPVTKRTRS